MQASDPNTGATPATADQISQALHHHARVHGSSMIWLTVDAPAPAADPLSEELAEALASPAAQAVRIAHREVDPTLWPHWLPLDTASANGSLILRQSVEHALSETDPASLRQGKGRRIAGWMVFDGEVADASRHWARRMVGRRPNGQTCLVRLHDPAVLWALWPLLSDAQQHALLGPVSHWWLLNPAAQLTTLTSAAAPGSNDRQDRDSDWTNAQWTQIDRIGPLNTALREAPRMHVDSPVRTIEQARMVAMQAMGRAGEAGFDHPQDLTAYATHALTVHEAFDAHPAVKRALLNRSPGERYTALIQALSDQDWQLIRPSA